MPAQAKKRLLPRQAQQQIDSASDPAFRFEVSNGDQSDAVSHSEKRPAPEPFQSVLFTEPEAYIPVDGGGVPEIFPDLLLDQIVASITAGRDEYNLKPFFFTPLGSVEAVKYRYDILRDLEIQTLAASIASFAHAMRNMRSCLRQMEKLYYKRQKQSWFLDAVEIYSEAVRQLNHYLTHASLTSLGFRGLRGFLASYLESEDFVVLAADTEKLRADLKQVAYCIHIDGRRIIATNYETAPDYGADVLETFEKFSQGAARDYKFEFHSSPEMNHIEAAILDLVARIYPETFSFLEEYGVRHSNFLNSTIARFDREIQFYLACMEHVQRLSRTGLFFVIPWSPTSQRQWPPEGSSTLLSPTNSCAKERYR